ncbi:MAG TPA: shikimate kinase [Kiritimatiellia bacterium]|nr:shikimate kinase [Kiritimatiellia bacterium]HRZ12758.1 shikimate kinase [Kiritimatiellia bacterium]HSA18290.1 shikimate kinase [Kiritimatiellia bacterium]
MKHANLILVGFMGAGKSATGRRVAARLGRRFVDMDAVIEARAGRAIPEIFACEGEAHFRKLERALVLELAGQRDLVIAAGGGVVLNPDNLRDFERTGLVVCLSAALETILKRVGHHRNRPLLEGGDKEQRVRELLENRRALYEAVARQVETTDLTPDEVAARVLALYGEAPEAPV